MPVPDRLLRPGEAAVLLGCSARTVGRYACAGRLRACRLPSGHRRFDRRDVLALRDAA